MGLLDFSDNIDQTQTKMFCHFSCKMASCFSFSSPNRTVCNEPVKRISSCKQLSIVFRSSALGMPLGYFSLYAQSTADAEDIFQEVFLRYVRFTPQFESEEKATEYVKAEMERIQRNLIVRRTRLARKINLGSWNYFCTFTYDDQKHTENSFKAKLRDCFKKMCHRKGWIYIGVWERSPNSDRLHFHGLFNIPENAMVGELTEHRDYSSKTHRMQTTLQNSYFTDRFGRNDFEPINKQELPERDRLLNEVH